MGRYDPAAVGTEWKDEMLMGVMGYHQNKIREMYTEVMEWFGIVRGEDEDLWRWQRRYLDILEQEGPAIFDRIRD